MHWNAFLALLASWAHDPTQAATEHPRAAAAVSVAYAGLLEEAPPAPAPPKPKPGCTDCKQGRIYRPDGGWVRCPCGAAAAPPVSARPSLPAGAR